LKNGDGKVLAVLVEDNDIVHVSQDPHPPVQPNEGYRKG
jgi:hypothetical protein